jgi:hypothetical protein
MHRSDGSKKSSAAAQIGPFEPLMNECQLSTPALRKQSAG